jgi:dTDP-D-glucose 4,6-dehydratase
LALTLLVIGIKIIQVIVLFVIVLDVLTYAENRKNLTSLEYQENFRFVKGDIGDFLYNR